MVERFGEPPKILPVCLALAGVAVALVPGILLSFGVARTADLVYATTFAGFLGKTAGMTLISLGPAVFFLRTGVSHGGVDVFRIRQSGGK